MIINTISDTIKETKPLIAKNLTLPFAIIITFIFLSLMYFLLSANDIISTDPILQWIIKTGSLQTILFTLLVIALFLSTTLKMSQYLNYKKESLSSAYQSYHSAKIKQLDLKISDLSKEFSAISEDKEEELAELIKDKIEKTATHSYLTEIKGQIKDADYRIDIFKRGQSTLKRLYDEIESQERRGNLNLILGIVTAASGVILLIWFALLHEQATNDLNQFLISFLPRISIVILIEVFAYFFLGLYKRSLQEIKYFHNEATSIEHNFVAMEAAIQMDDKQLMDKCICSFLAIDRNSRTQELNSKNTDNDNPVSISSKELINLLKDISKK